MKRKAMVVAVGALALVPAAALGSHSGNGGPRDFAVGSAKNTFETEEPNHLMVAAHGFEADVTGHVRARGELLGPLVGEFKLEGEVTCLRVEGNRAALKYRFKHAQGSAAAFQDGGVQVFVEDNRQTGQPDRNTFDPPQPALVFQTNAHVCSDPDRLDYDPIDSGNYVVHDAGPPPSG